MTDRQGWTRIDDQVLVRMVSEERRNSAIAAVLGRTVMSVAARSHHLRDQGVAVPYAYGVGKSETPKLPDLRPGRPRQSHSTWTSVDDMEVLSMARRGRTSIEIGRAIGRGAGAVRMRLVTLRARAAEREREERHHDRG